MKIDGTLRVIEDHDGSLTGIEARPVALEARIGIEGRGNSSWGWYAQKPYGFEVRDATGGGMPVTLLGLPREADFVLHSCYSDKTCMRNALSYEIAREIARPAGRWSAPRTRWVEVYLEGRYNGLYSLVEKIKRDRSRVALPEPAKDAASGDVTGGSIFSLEGDRNKGTRSWVDAMNPTRFWRLRYPNYQVITPAQKTYLQQAVAKMQMALAANPRWSEVKKLFEADAPIDQMLMNELTNNTDAYFASWYFTKQSDLLGGKFSFGPCGTPTSGTATSTTTSATAATTRWPGGWACPGPGRRCSPTRTCAPSCAAATTSCAAPGPPWTSRASRRASTPGPGTSSGPSGKYVWPNNFVAASWGDEVKYLECWLRRRLAFLDTSFGGAPACASAPSAAAPAQVPAPAAARETVARSPLCCNAAPAWVPIEGTVPAPVAMYACP